MTTCTSPNFARKSTFVPARATTRAMLAAAVLGAGALYSGANFAQQVQLPTLQVCNTTKLSASATVQIESRIDVGHTGTFSLRGELSCNPTSTNPYPSGALSIVGVSMSDSALQGDIMLSTYEQFTSTGKHSPTAWLNGRCKVFTSEKAATPV